jgi:hypothetical protein
MGRIVTFVLHVEVEQRRTSLVAGRMIRRIGTTGCEHPATPNATNGTD